MGLVFYAGGSAGGGSAPANTVLGPGSSTDNAIVRWNGTTGIDVQDSAITVSDVAAASVTVATVPGASPGIALVVNVTEPDATTGASVAGKGLTLNAGDAVASTDTAGAAAGGAVTITGGAAARNASGNANGGNITLTGGAGIGTGVSGSVVANGLEVTSTAWLASADGVQTVGASSSRRPLIYAYGLSSGSTIAAGEVRWSTGAGAGTVLQNTAMNLGSNLLLGWSSNDPVSNAKDVHFGRAAAGVVYVGNGSGTEVDGWIQWAGNKRNTADQTVTDSDTLVASTDLTVSCAAGRSYIFQADLYFTTVNTSGVKVAIAGTATHTNIIYDVIVHGISTPGFLTSGRGTAAGTAVGVTASGTAAHVTITGTTTINALGTVLVQFAQNAETGAAESVILLRGSSLLVVDVS